MTGGALNQDQSGGNGEDPHRDPLQVLLDEHNRLSGLAMALVDVVGDTEINLRKLRSATAATLRKSLDEVQRALGMLIDERQRR